MKKLLLMAVAALTSVATWAIEKPTLKYSELKPDVEYYLLNVETNAYITGANDWGTRASVTTESMGYKVKIVANGETYQLCNNKSSDFSTRFDCDGGKSTWVDGQGRTGDGLWSFKAIGNNTYEIYNSNAGDAKWGVYPDLSNTRILFTDAKATATTWAFITDEALKEYNEALIAYKRASTEKGEDVTICFDALSPAKASNGGWKIPSGWTIETENQNGAFHVNTWSSEGNSDGSNMKTPFFERWVGGGETLNACKMTTTLDGLNPNSVYELSALFRILFENGGVEVDKVNLLIGNKVVDVCEKGIAMNKGKYGTFSVQGMANEEGKLVVGVEVLEGTKASWVTWKNMKLTYVGSAQDALNEILTEATKQASENMDAGVKEKLLGIIKQYTDATVTAENFDAISSIIEGSVMDAKASAGEYANAKAIADAAKNFYPVKAKAIGADVTSAITAWEEAYANGKLNGNTEANGIAKAYDDALAAKLAECTDITSLITNPSFETRNMDGWTANNIGNAATNKNFGALTGEIFAERWTGAGGKLGDGTLTQTLAALPKGEYILTVDAKNEQQSGNTAQTGMFVTIGDMQYEINSASVDHAAISYTTTEATTDITIGIKLVDCQGNWICYDNFKLYFNGIYTKALIDLIADAKTYAATIKDKSYVTALNTAIETAETTLNAGFTKGEEVTAAVNALNDAINAAKLEARKETYADVTPGKYIIATQGDEGYLFLGAGNSWGTQASLLAHPEIVEIAKLDNGKYTIKSQVSNGGNSQYFNGSYMDGAATGIEIIGGADMEGYYSAALSDGSKYYYNNNGVVGQNENAETIWALISEELWETMGLYDADEDYPFDMTYRVQDPNFGRNNVNNGAWEKNNVTKGGDNANQLYEAFHKTFSIKQTITELPEGVYEVRANAFYRQDGEEVKLPYIFANGVKADFVAREEADAESANSMSGAAAKFAEGKYSVSVKVYVKAGQLRIGAATEGTTCWSIFDNFQLYYLGTEAEAENSEYAGLNIAAVDKAETNYGTFCAPFAVALSEGTSAYTVTATKEGGTLVLNEVKTTIPANTPVIVASATGVSIDAFGAYVEGTCTVGLLTGVYAKTPAVHGSYVLQNQNNVVGFYPVLNDDVTVPANRCYLTPVGEDDERAKAYYFDIDSATAIEAVSALTAGKAQIYDMNGRKLNKLQKGINIVNGVKVLVK